MSKKIFLIAGLSLLLFSCKEKKQPVLAPEYLYKDINQRVISSLINNKESTVSIIYGNELALRSAGDSLGIHIPGEQYTMVTWKQKPMPHWYGTNMNGSIIRVETVDVSQNSRGELSFGYQQKRGQKDGEARDSGEKESRIRFITGQRAAVFP